MGLSRANTHLQVRKFGRHPNYPQDREGVDVLIAALMDACSSDEMVDEVVAYMLRNLRFAPLPVDIYEAADAVAMKRAQEAQAAAPSYKATAGEFGRSLVDTMTDEDAEKWRGALRRAISSPKANDAFIRKAALTWLTAYYHFVGKPDEAIELAREVTEAERALLKQPKKLDIRTLEAEIAARKKTG